MNDCTLYDIQLADYSAGELREPDLGAVESHLAQCANCRAELAREIELRQVLSGLPQVNCPQRVTTTLHESLAQVETRTAFTRRWSVGLPLVAATLLAVLLVRALWQEPNAPVPNAVPTADVAAQYTAAEIDQARREVIASLVLAADILDRSRDKTVVDVFGARLPRAISQSLVPRSSDAQNSTINTNAAHTGGNG